MLHLRDLCCFIKVYELGSFSRAGDSLGMVQSMVSSRVQRLEQFIEAPLFQRLHRRIVPTKKGELMYQYAKRVVHEVEELKSAVKYGTA